MIRYALACDAGHAFESWFPSSDSFDAQKAAGYVSCPVCGSTSVDKQLMRPSVARTDREKASPPMPAAAPVPEAAPAPAQDMAVLSEKDREIRAMIRALREHVVAHAENVGTRFAEEARKIHHGESEARSIYGAASAEEARALMEEGVAFHPLPALPDERN